MTPALKAALVRDEMQRQGWNFYIAEPSNDQLAKLFDVVEAEVKRDLAADPFAFMEELGLVEG